MNARTLVGGTTKWHLCQKETNNEWDCSLQAPYVLFTVKPYCDDSLLGIVQGLISNPYRRNPDWVIMLFDKNSIS